MAPPKLSYRCLLAGSDFHARTALWVSPVMLTQSSQGHRGSPAQSDELFCGSFSGADTLHFGDFRSAAVDPIVERRHGQAHGWQSERGASQLDLDGGAQLRACRAGLGAVQVVDGVPVGIARAKLGRVRGICRKACRLPPSG